MPGFHHRLFPLAGASLCCALLGVLGSCSSDPVDAAGDYTIAITSRENGCDFENWEEDATASNIAVAITQDGSDVELEVGGLAAVALDVLHGSHVFVGSVDGDAIEGSIFGANQLNRDSCPFVVNSTIKATLDGDVLRGNIRYTADGNGSPACAAIEGCVSRQEFNGTRPPQ